MVSKKRHIYREHKQTKSHCDECGKIYKNKFQLKTHWKLTHQMEKDSHSTICSKSFQNMSKLKRHMKNCITKENINVSDDLECPISLGSQNYASSPDGEEENTVQKEIKTSEIDFEVNSSAESLVCNLCDLVFPNINKLKLHTIKCLSKLRSKEQP